MEIPLASASSDSSPYAAPARLREQLLRTGVTRGAAYVAVGSAVTRSGWGHHVRRPVESVLLFGSAVAHMLLMRVGTTRLIHSARAGSDSQERIALVVPDQQQCRARRSTESADDC